MLKKRFRQWRISRFFDQAPVKKLNIGAGKEGMPESKDGWVRTDIQTLDITSSDNWKKLLGKNQLDLIMAEHVWEHLTEEQTKLANELCYQNIKVNGKLRIAVPDGLNPDKEYIENVRPGGQGAGADDHKILYTYLIMRERLEAAGFSAVFLEYWDENGTFHYQEWDPEEGFIRRSKRFDPRNQDGKLNYTSLIVDAVKLH